MDIAILFISFSNSSKRINTGPKYFSGTLYVVAAKYRNALTIKRN